MQSINLKIGMVAVEAVLEILRSNEVEYFTLVAYNTCKEKKQPLVVEHLLRHSNRANEKRLELEVKRTTVKDIENIVSNLGKQMALGVISLVTVFDKKYYIPMIDFNCKLFDENDVKILKEFLRYIGERRGAILASGRSYHYYGARLFKHGEWLEFLGKCSLF